MPLCVAEKSTVEQCGTNGEGEGEGEDGGEGEGEVGTSDHVDNDEW